MYLDASLSDKQGQGDRHDPEEVVGKKDVKTFVLSVM